MWGMAGALKGRRMGVGGFGGKGGECGVFGFGETDWKVRSTLVMPVERLGRPFRAWGFCWGLPGAMPQAITFGPRWARG